MSVKAEGKLPGKAIFHFSRRSIAVPKATSLYVKMTAFCTTSTTRSVVETSSHCYGDGDDDHSPTSLSARIPNQRRTFCKRVLPLPSTQCFRRKFFFSVKKETGEKRKEDKNSRSPSLPLLAEHLNDPNHLLSPTTGVEFLAAHTHTHLLVGIGVQQPTEQ